MPAKKLSARSAGEPTDAALVVAARGGEEWACEALFRRYVPMANGLAFRAMGRDDDIEDLVQDSFVQALDGLGRLHDPQAFAAWLSSIVVRTATRMLRRRQLLRRLGFGGDATALDVDALLSPDAPPDVAAELRAIYAIIDRLPAEQRMALVLRRVEGLELEEIARAMGLSLATIKRRLVDAEAALKRAMADGPQAKAKPGTVTAITRVTPGGVVE